MIPHKIFIANSEFLWQLILLVLLLSVSILCWVVTSYFSTPSSAIGVFLAGATLCSTYWLMLLIGGRKILNDHVKSSGSKVGTSLFLLKTVCLFVMIAIGLEWSRETKLFFLSGFGLTTGLILVAFWVLYLKRDSLFD